MGKSGGSARTRPEAGKGCALCLLRQAHHGSVKPPLRRLFPRPETMASKTSRSHSALAAQLLQALDSSELPSRALRLCDWRPGELARQRATFQRNTSSARMNVARNRLDTGFKTKMAMRAEGVSSSPKDAQVNVRWNIHERDEIRCLKSIIYRTRYTPCFKICNPTSLCLNNHTHHHHR